MSDFDSEEMDDEDEGDESGGEGQAQLPASGLDDEELDYEEDLEEEEEEVADPKRWYSLPLSVPQIRKLYFIMQVL